VSGHCYSEINLHVTWHVKDNAPVLRDDLEKQVHGHLRRRAAETAGLLCHEVGGTDDHVHLVVSTPPTLCISEWIGRMKGASSHYINQMIANRKVLQWQTGYGVVSFGTRDLAWVVEYVRRQREHHAAGTTHERLERIEDDPGEAP